MAISTQLATTLTGTLPAPGIGFRRGSTPGLLWRKNQRRFSRKVGLNAITAKFELKPPPYPLDALEPYMSQETLECHWGNHHRAYVENLNNQLFKPISEEEASTEENSEEESKEESLEESKKKSSKKKSKGKSKKDSEEQDDEPLFKQFKQWTDEDVKEYLAELEAKEKAIEEAKKQITPEELEGMSLEDLVVRAYNKGDSLPSFKNAAQVWNHEFFWESMKPGGGGTPSGNLLAMMERDFGSFERFVEEFKRAAATQYGSGWAWLAYKANKLDVGNAVNPLATEEDRKLVIVKTPDAVNPLVWDYSPLLAIDVWEHAYYTDYQIRRPDYISTFLEKLVSWDAVSLRLEKAKARAAERDQEEERKKMERDQEEERKKMEEMDQGYESEHKIYYVDVEDSEPDWRDHVKNGGNGGQ